MIDLWSNKQAARAVVDDARSAARRGSHRWLRGKPGTGRRLAFTRVAEAPEVIAFELLRTSELDAGLHLLVQLCRALELPVEPSVTSPDESEADALDALRAVGERLGAIGRSRGKTLALLLPIDWPRALPRERDDGDESAAARRVDALLHGLHASRIATIVISTAAADHPWQASADRIDLPAPLVNGAAIQPDEVPPIRDAAAVVARVLTRDVSPIEARMLVGLSALGRPVDLSLLRSHGIARQLVAALSQRPLLRRAARTLAMSRRGVLTERVPQLFPLEPFDLGLLTNCLGYGDRVTRIIEAVRDELLGGVGRDPTNDADHHVTLASYHRTLDGAASPDTLDQGRAIDWLEKLHHLAHGGDESQDEWATQRKLGRESYWERARCLSRVERRYGEAGALYRQCLEEFGPDAYTHHYLGFNLDRAGGASAEVAAHYRKAVELDRANPWWNARLITFLIAHGTLEEAHQAWRRACAEIDPEHDRGEQSPWLARHLHRWVIRQWLALGRVREARAVLDDVATRWIDEDATLRQLDELVRDAEEALVLGESVYPAEIPVDERWRGPRVTVARNGKGSPRARWWPGRVLEYADGEVIVALADPENRSAHRVAYADDEWRQMAEQEPSDAAGFFELAEYTDGSRQIRFVPSRSGEPLADELQLLAARAFPP